MLELLKDTYEFQGGYKSIPKSKNIHGLFSGLQMGENLTLIKQLCNSTISTKHTSWQRHIGTELERFKDLLLSTDKGAHLDYASAFGFHKNVLQTFEDILLMSETTPRNGKPINMRDDACRWLQYI
jgi:hypothetical protein